MYFICWRRLSSFVCCFSEKFITSITTTNSILVAELMPVRKSLQSPQCYVYTSCIKKRKGRNSASDGNCYQIAIFIMKRKLDFQDQQRTLAGQARSQDLRSHTSGQGLGQEGEECNGKDTASGSQNERTIRERPRQTTGRMREWLQGISCIHTIAPAFWPHWHVS